MQLDDLPATATGKASYPTVDDELPPQQEDTFDHLDFGQLITHKNWKARKVAFEQLASSDPNADVGAFVNNLSLFAKDGATPALDALMEAAAAVLLADPSTAATLAGSSLVQVAMEKGLVGRPRAASAASRFLCECVGAGHGAPISAALFTGCSAKAPKARIAAVQTMASCVQEFGVQWLNVKLLLRSLTPLFNDTDAKVRKEAQTLCVLCYRFVGESVRGYLSDLREVQQLELAKLFDEVKCDVQASRRIGGGQGQQRNSGGVASGRSSSSNGAALASSTDLDPFADLPEQAVLPRLPPNFFEAARDRDAKWAERVDYVTENLLKWLSVPRITQQADYTDVVKAIRDFINDPQLPIMTVGIKCLQAIARSLRNGLQPYVRFLIPALFDKFKDKKASILEAVTSSIRTLIRYNCCGYDNCQEELENCVASKLPNQRHAALSWAINVLDTEEDPAASCQKMLRAPAMLRRAISDEKLEVREAGIAMLSKCIQIAGTGPFKDVLQTLDDKQKAKLGVAAAGSGIVAAAPAPGRQATGPVRPPGPLATAAANTLSVGSRNAKVVPRAVGGVAAAAPSAAADDLGPVMLAETAQQILETCLPADAVDAVKGLGDAAWRVRADSAAAIGAAVTTLLPQACTDVTNALAVWLKSVTGGKETLFQVVNATASMCCAALSNAESITGRSGALLVNQFVTKLTEAKSRSVVRELLSAVTEHVGPRATLRLVCSSVAEAANPKLTVEVLEWMEVALQEFADASVDGKALTDFVKGYVLEQPTPAVKQAGVKLLAVLRWRVGPKLDALLGSLNAHVRQNYEDAVVAFRPGTVPTRAIRATAARPGAPATSRGAAAGPARLAAAADDDADLPATDISGTLAMASKEMVNAKDWRQRAIAVKSIEDAVNSSARNIGAAGVADALRALRTRLDEPNKNFVVDVLRTINLLLEAAPPSGSRPGARAVFPGVVSMLGDMKQVLREEAFRCCTLCLNAVGLEALLQPFVKALSTENQSARLSLAELMATSLNAGHHTAFAPKGMLPLVQPLLRMLVDRNQETRQRAELCMAFALSNVGLDSVMRSMTVFKPMDQKLMAPIVERIRPIEHAVPVAPAAVARVHVPNPDDVATAPLPLTYNVMHHSDSQDSHGFAATLQHAPPQPAATTTAAPRRIFSLSEIGAGLKTARDGAIPQLCADLQAIVEGDVMSVDFRTVEALLSRARSLFLVGNGPQTDDGYAAARSVFVLICNLVSNPAFASHLLADDVAAITNTCFSCIQCPAAAEPHAQDILKTINAIMARVLQNAHPNVLMTVFVTMLMEHCERDLVDPTPYTKKCIDLTCKCLYKMTNFTHAFSPDRVIPLTATFLQRLPPSTFRTRDDAPVRCIKNLLKHTLANQDPDEMLELCQALVGSTSLVYSFIQLWQTRTRQEAEQQEAVVQHAATRGVGEHHQPSSSSSTYNSYASLSGEVQQPRASVRHRDPADSERGGRVTGTAYAQQQPPAPRVSMAVPNAVDHAAVVAMFGRARKHDTSAQGMKELYLHLRNNPKCPFFVDQYNSCTDVFKRHIDTIMTRLRDAEGMA